MQELAQIKEATSPDNIFLAGADDPEDGVAEGKVKRRCAACRTHGALSFLTCKRSHPRNAPPRWMLLGSVIMATSFILPLQAGHSSEGRTITIDEKGRPLSACDAP